MPTSIRSFTISAVVLVHGPSDEWMLLTFIAATTGVTVGTRGAREELNVPNGLLLPVDVPVEILVAPGTAVYAGGEVEGVLGIIEQPLPFVAQLALAVQNLFRSRAA